MAVFSTLLRKVRKERSKTLWLQNQFHVDSVWFQFLSLEPSTPLGIWHLSTDINHPLPPESPTVDVWMNCFLEIPTIGPQLDTPSVPQWGENIRKCRLYIMLLRLTIPQNDHGIWLYRYNIVYIYIIYVYIIFDLHFTCKILRRSSPPQKIEDEHNATWWNLQGPTPQSPPRSCLSSFHCPS